MFSTRFHKINSSHDKDLLTSTLRSTEVRCEYEENESRLISDHLPGPHRDTPSTSFNTSTRVHAR